MSDPPSPSPEPTIEREDRPTLVPPFNVETAARESDAAIALKTPLAHPTPFRDEMDTLTDETELEAARVKSIYPSLPPPVDTDDESTGPLTARRPVDGDPDLEIDDGIDPFDEARVLVASGDETGALAIVEEILKENPTSFPARQIAEQCERALVAKYTARLGSLDRIPRIVVPEDHLVGLALDHRAGFLLALVDGASEIDAIVDISGLPAPDALRAIVELYERGVIVLS